MAFRKDLGRTDGKDVWYVVNDSNANVTSYDLAALNISLRFRGQSLPDGVMQFDAHDYVYFAVGTVTIGDATVSAGFFADKLCDLLNMAEETAIELAGLDTPNGL